MKIGQVLGSRRINVGIKRPEFGERNEKNREI